MFMNSKFNKDINQWNISNIKIMDYMFHNLSEFRPYWYIEDIDLRKQAIKKYKFKHQLENDLNNEKTIIKRQKI